MGFRMDRTRARRLEGAARQLEGGLRQCLEFIAEVLRWRRFKKILAEEQALKHERHCHGRHDIPRFKQTKERGNRHELQTCNHRSGGRYFYRRDDPICL